MPFTGTHLPWFVLGQGSKCGVVSTNQAISTTGAQKLLIIGLKNVASPRVYLIPMGGQVVSGICMKSTAW